jgi:hypothetical protein
MPLDPRDRDKLIKLLGMIGSSADGEALNAARLANKLVVDRGLTWGQVLAINGAAPVWPQAAQQTVWPGSWTPKPPPQPPPFNGGERWRTIADFMLNYHTDDLNDWELHFLDSIIRRRSVLSEKQMATLVKIGTKCGVIVD